MKLHMPLAAVAALALLTGCGPEVTHTATPSTPATTVSATPEATPEALPSATPSESPSDLPAEAPPRTPARPGVPPAAGRPSLLLTPDGVGPYRIGARIQPSLVTAASPVDSACPDVAFQQATGRYAGAIDVFTKGGVVFEVQVSARAHTREGAQVGKPLSHVSRIYGARTKTWRGEGGIPVAAVTVGRNSMVFTGASEEPHAVRRVHIGRSAVVSQHVTDVWPCF